MQYRAFLLSAAASIPVMAAQSAFAQQASTGVPEIVITASPLAQRIDETATPVIVLSGDELVRRRQATLGDTLAGQPGVNFDNFGGGASRPVIRGQTSPRVQTLSDGADIHDGSAISPDHAVVTEPLLLRGVEVLRGPAALLYGGTAIGGAINLLDEKVPTAIPDGGFSGALEGRLGTADEEKSLVGGVTGGIGSFAFRAEGAYRDSDDYRVPKPFGERHVDGSYNETSTFTVGGSWVGLDGYLGAAYTRQRSEYGLPGHSHEYEGCHPHDTVLHCEEHDHGDGDEGEDHEEEHEDEDHEDEHEGEHAHGEVPVIKLRSERFDIRGDYQDLLPGIEKARLRFSYTDYEHDEIEEEQIATTFKNKAHDTRLELTHAPIGRLRGVFGFQYSDKNFSALGEESFLPESDTRNTALFLIETLQTGPVRFEVAARQEWQTVETTLDRENDHNPSSISGAAIWDMGGSYSLALSLARSQRAPNVQELYADGIHLATNTYELGTSTLGKETAKSIDLTFRKSAGDTTFTLGTYHQNFDNYIFADTLDRFEDFRLIQYSRADAAFTGLDGEIRQQVTEQVGISVFGDYVRAKFKSDIGDVPRIPGGRLGGRVDGKWDRFSADFEYYRVFSQDKIAAFETQTRGYDMLNATMAYRVDLNSRTNAEVFVRATNLTGELAYNHASFIKDASPLRGRNFVFGLRTAF